MSLMTTILLTYGVTLATAVAVLTLDALRRRVAALGVAIAGLTVSAAAGLATAVTHPAGAGFGPVMAGGPASVIYGVIAFAGVASVCGGLDELRSSERGGGVAALMAFTVAAAGATAAATDLVTLLLAIETMALAGYVLVAMAGTARSGEAAMKYFVQGAVATGLLLFGIAILLTLFEPSGGYDRLIAALSKVSPLLPGLAGIGLVLCALAFKMGAAPFHSWAPDAYETAPAESAAFLASGPKLAAISAAAVFIAVVGRGDVQNRVAVAVCVLAVASVLVGSLAALRQTDYRRMLGYAGVAQSGYALVAIALFNPSLATFFGTTYALAAVGTFLAAQAFTRARPDWDGSIAGLAGLGRQAPVLSGAVGILLISLAGLPPFLGFWAKLLVFGTGLTRAIGGMDTAPITSWAYAVAVSAGLLGSIISLGYYGGVLRSLFFEEAPVHPEVDEEVPVASGTTGSAGVTVIALAALIIAASIVPFLMGSGYLLGLFTIQ